MHTFTIDQTRPDEQVAAFRLAFHYLDDEEERTSRVAGAQSLVSLGELEPEGIFVVRSEEGIRGAMVCVPLPGAGGLVWPPYVMDGPERAAAEDQLVSHGCRWLRRRGARLAQALLTAREIQLAEPLERNGFQHISQLVYLRHHLQAENVPAPDRKLRCLPYHRVDPDQFHETLLRTYAGTLDCPELNGVRTVEEIIAGHRGQGNFDPARWWLLFDHETVVGVVLMAEVPELAAWDLTYLGIVPEARRRGYGRLLVQLVLAAARAAEVDRLIVAVDDRNLPACNLYRNLGFEEYDRREIYLAIFACASQLVG